MDQYADRLLDALRRHIRSYQPGTLIGSELELAGILREIEGEVWAPWCVEGDPSANGEAEYQETLAWIEEQGRHRVVPV